MFKSLSTSLIARGILAAVVGIIALAWPSVTVLALVILFAVYAFIAAGLQAGTRVMFILGGLVTVAFGVVLSARPGLGAITLALLFGLFNLIFGIWMLVQGIELRRTNKTLQSVTPAKLEKNPA